MSKGKGRKQSIGIGDEDGKIGYGVEGSGGRLIKSGLGGKCDCLSEHPRG